MVKKIFTAGLILLLVIPQLKSQDNKKWTLDECIAYALEQNIGVRKTGLALKSLENQTLQARAQRFPSVNATVSQSFGWNRGLDSTGYSNGFYGSSGTGISLNTGITLFNGSRITNIIKQAELDSEAGRYELETTKESLSLNILAAFMQVLFSEEQVKNSEKQIESTLQQLNLAKERLNIKIISQADYAQINSQLASEKLTLVNAIGDLEMAKVSLMQLMELPVIETFEIERPQIADSVNENRSPVIEEIYDSALSVKPQIKSAEINKKIALLDEKIAKSAYFPVLSASAGLSSRTNYSSQSENEEIFVDQINHSLNPSAGLTLSIPLYQKRQVRTDVAQAKIGFENAEISETDTRNQLRKNIEQACQDVISAQSRYEASYENYLATSESALLSDEKYKQGIINSVDYLVSKTALILAESQLLQSKYNLLFSYKILDFYSGIPLSL